jgi:hypothetical protein
MPLFKRFFPLYAPRLMRESKVIQAFVRDWNNGESDNKKPVKDVA